MNRYTSIEYQTKNNIESYQQTKLKELLHYLQQNSPYYRKQFSQYCIVPDIITQLEDLKNIPTTSKQNFAEYNDEFLCVPYSKIADYCATSGTTGTPVTVALTDNDLKRLAYNEEQSFLIAGCKPTDVFMLLLTLDRQFMAGMAYYQGIRKLGGGVIRSGVVSPQAQWENIQRFKPNVLVAVPSFLLKMIEYANAHQIDCNSSSVAKVICIGEPVRHADFTPNNLACRIKAHWNVELYSTYASTEMQTAFTECSCGKGGHLRPELMIVEVLDDEGNPVRTGEMGEVTITTLGVEGMPLLRYRTGDICALYDDTCSCGRNSVRLSPVTGRKNQMIKFKGTTFFPPAIYDALSQVPQINDYVVEVSKNEMGMDEVMIHISITGNLDIVESQILSTLRAKLRVTPSIQFTSSSQLQSLRPKESRKPTMVVFR
ncbi:MAG: AMP-binding protein [Bacteroidetes bacterium]|nr:AMP-binding protein [Bacteroidota bacterium]